MPPGPILTTPRGALWRAEAVEWMGALPSECARLVVADPPYNLGKAPWDSLGSRQAYLDWTLGWIRQAQRLLTPDGSLYICGFPEPLASIASAASPMFASFRSLIWFYRNKASLADDWGRSHEGLLHLRRGKRFVFNTDDVRVPYNDHTVRYPERTQAATSHFAGGASPGSRRWRPHPRGARPRDVLEIPTLCNGSAEKTAHPTQKPEELIRRLVLASSMPEDLVIDPFGGSGTTYAVCEATGRRWMGCEREREYCELIARRLSEPDRFRARQADETAPARSRRRSRLREGPS